MTEKHSMPARALGQLLPGAIRTFVMPPARIPGPFQQPTRGAGGRRNRAANRARFRAVTPSAVAISAKTHGARAVDSQTAQEVAVAPRLRRKGDTVGFAAARHHMEVGVLRAAEGFGEAQVAGCTGEAGGQGQNRGWRAWPKWSGWDRKPRADVRAPNGVGGERGNDGAKMAWNTDGRRSCPQRSARRSRGAQGRGSRESYDWADGSAGARRMQEHAERRRAPADERVVAAASSSAKSGQLERLWGGKAAAVDAAGAWAGVEVVGKRDSSKIGSLGAFSGGGGGASGAAWRDEAPQQVPEAAGYQDVEAELVAMDMRSAERGRSRRRHQRQGAARNAPGTEVGARKKKKAQGGESLSGIGGQLVEQSGGSRTQRAYGHGAHVKSRGE